MKQSFAKTWTNLKVVSKQNRYRITLLLLVFVITGCSYPMLTRTLTITYKSDPSGAILYENGRNLGYTPISVIYEATLADIRRGFILINSPSVRWASGVTSALETNRIDLSKGYHQEYTFFRPENIPGREKDVSYGLEIEKIMMRQNLYHLINTSHEKPEIVSMIDAFMKGAASGGGTTGLGALGRSYTQGAEDADKRIAERRAQQLQAYEMLYDLDR